MADATKPSIEEIRARLAAASPGPWWFDTGQDWGASWGIVSGTGDHMRYVAKPYGDADRAAITAYPTDVAFLLERDAAREKRLAEIEAQLAGIRERARAVVQRLDNTAELALGCGADPDEIVRIVRGIGFDKERIIHVVGDLGEPAAREGEGDAG